MNDMTAFDWAVLAGLVLLVTVWLVRRIRSSLKADCCGTEPNECPGCSGGCSARQRAAGSCTPKKPG